VALLPIDLDPSPRALRRFGIAGFVVLGGLGLFGPRLLGLGAAFALGLLAVGLLFGALALAAPRALRPFYLALSIATLPVAVPLSWALLAAAWFLVLTPVALVARALGRDALALRAPPPGTSLWRPRRPHPDPERYFRPY
jgi:hypothetical protein